MLHLGAAFEIIQLNAIGIAAAIVLFCAFIAIFCVFPWLVMTVPFSPRTWRFQGSIRQKPVMAMIILFILAFAAVHVGVTYGGWNEAIAARSAIKSEAK